MNIQRNKGRSVTEGLPIRYDLVDKDGHTLPEKFRSVAEAWAFANGRWPDQEQDEDRTGKGWDIQIAGMT